MKKIIYILPILILVVLASCKQTTSDTSEKEAPVVSKLDSMDLAHAQSVRRSGDYISKAYVSDGLLYLNANIKKDHRVFGYAKPDTLSERLFLLSVFTNDVENNPFNLAVGAHYELDMYTQLRIKYQSHDARFVKAVATDSVGKKTTLYFEKKWVDLEGELDE
jgi:hypothetical protein